LHDVPAEERLPVDEGPDEVAEQCCLPGLPRRGEDDPAADRPQQVHPVGDVLIGGGEELVEADQGRQIVAVGLHAGRRRAVGAVPVAELLVGLLDLAQRLLQRVGVPVGLLNPWIGDVLHGGERFDLRHVPGLQ
jgi:hypothetical protein